MAQKTKVDNDFSVYVKRFWLLLLFGIIAIFLFFMLTAWGVFGKLPSIAEIENPKSNLASEIITADGETLGKFYLDNRTHSDYEDLSPNLVNALVATEDERFYEHSAVDFRALVRAVTKLGRDGGGSTITQQLAKQLFSEKPKSIIDRLKQKSKEWIISVRLERRFTKQELIAMYLNQYNFIYQAVGIKSASAIYFNTTPDKLTIEQAAVLVGMAKSPTLYNPKRNPENALKRRNTVYQQMMRNDMLSQQAYDTLSIKPIVLDFKAQSHLDGLAPYLREYLRSYMKDWVKEHPKPNGEEYNIYTDGLKIYTSVDSRMQLYAEQAVTEHFSNLQRVFFKKEQDRKFAPFHNVNQDEIDKILDQAKRRTPRYKALMRNNTPKDSIDFIFNKPIPMTVFSWGDDIDTVMSPIDSIRYYKYFYQAGLLSVEPQTGFVKAWVGGIDYKHFKYDHVKQGKRQVGSTFKPFVYATAIKQKHFSPCMLVPNVRTCIERGRFDILKDWCPENSDNKYGGMVTLKDGLANSMNTVTTYLMREVGPEPVVRMVQEMGVKGEIPIQPSIALGSVDVSLYEMVGAYTTFANKGVYTEPIVITRIEDKNGVVLQEFNPPTNEVMSEEDAYVVLDLLKGVTKGGTGTRLGLSNYNSIDGVVTGAPWALTNPIAGKTGTTQNNSDGWFMGVVPNLVTGVWGGCEDRAAHFGGTYYGQGATVALPAWAIYMKKCYADKDLNVSKADFERPNEPITVDLNCKDGVSPDNEFDTLEQNTSSEFDL